MARNRVLKCLAGICAIVFLMSGCAGAGDWTYHNLPGNYEIWRNNSRSIELNQVVEDGLGESVIPAYVSEIAFDEKYIFAKQVEVPDSLDEKIDLSNPVYYMVLVESEELLGPFTKEEFEEQCAKRKITKQPNWIKTTDLPDKDYGQ